LHHGGALRPGDHGELPGGPQRGRCRLHPAVGEVGVLARRDVDVSGDDQGVIAAVAVAVGVVAGAAVQTVRRVAEHEVGGLVELGQQVGGGLQAYLELARRGAADDQQQPGRRLAGALDGPHGPAEAAGPPAAPQPLESAPHAPLPPPVSGVIGHRVMPAVAFHRRALLAQAVQLGQGVGAGAQRAQHVGFGGQRHDMPPNKSG
jgi:hypothetical protein